MTNMNKRFDEFWYVVVPREVNDPDDGVYSQWVVLKGGSYHPIVTFDNKSPAVERAKELAEKQGRAGVIVGTTLGDVSAVITNNESVFFEVARRKAQEEVGL